MSLKKAFGSNKDKEQNGVWVDILENDDGTICRVKLAYAGDRNKAMNKKQAEIFKLARGKRGSDDQEEIKRKGLQVLFGTVVLDWENVVEYRTEKLTGIPVNAPLPRMEFNEDNFMFIMEDLPNLADLIVRESLAIRNFQDDEEKEMVKNSFPTTNIN